MGFIDYEHNGSQTSRATIYDENRKFVANAQLAFNGLYWELQPEPFAFKDKILRALDSHNIYF